MAVWGQPLAVYATIGGLGIILLVFGLFGRRLNGLRLRLGPGRAEMTFEPEDRPIVHPGGAPPTPRTLPAEHAAELSARYPTLEHALAGVPVSWDRSTEEHADGHQYVHLRSRHGAYEIVLSTAALDGPAPGWLLLAIDSME